MTPVRRSTVTNKTKKIEIGGRKSILIIMITLAPQCIIGLSSIAVLKFLDSASRRLLYKTIHEKLLLEITPSPLTTPHPEITLLVYLSTFNLLAIQIPLTAYLFNRWGILQATADNLANIYPTTKKLLTYIAIQIAPIMFFYGTLYTNGTPININDHEIVNYIFEILILSLKPLPIIASSTISIAALIYVRRIFHP